MNPGDLIRFKERYAPPENPPMLLVRKAYKNNKHYLIAHHPRGVEHWIDLGHVWWYEEVCSGSE